MSGSPVGTNVALRAAGSLSGHATDRNSLSRRGRLRRRGRRPGLRSGPARRHRRARLHQLRTEHSVVRMAGVRRARTPTAFATTTTRTTSSRPRRSSTPRAPTPARAGPTGAGWRTLQHGGQYGICAQGQYSFPNDSLWFPDGPNSCSMGTQLGRRAYTTIDRSKPTAAVQLAAGAALRQGHEDPAADRLRRRRRRPVPRELPLLRGRRRPRQPLRRERGQDLRLQRALLGPGQRRQVDHVHLHRRLRRDPGRDRVGLRARGRRLDPGQPERLQPDRHGGQGQPVRSELRRRRRRPHRRRRSRSAWPPPSVKVGDLVSLQATASDATSGLAGAGQWTWGDNTGAGAATPSRTRTRSPGRTRWR